MQICYIESTVGRNVRIILELFRLIDVHDEMALNDVQFCAFMKTATDLNTNQIYKVFDMLDVDGSGAMDFDEFYLLICILIAVQDKVEKNFIYRHSRTVFDLLDEDSSGNISAYEFETFGFLFNLQGEAIRTIFGEFDVSGDQVCTLGGMENDGVQCWVSSLERRLVWFGVCSLQFGVRCRVRSEERTVRSVEFEARSE